MKNNPMFQHRHYATIAALLAEEGASSAIKTAFAELFKADNPERFNWRRFLDAANGVPSNGRDKADSHRRYINRLNKQADEVNREL